MAQWQRVAAAVLAVVLAVVLAFAVFFEYRRVAVPNSRDTVTQPIYTIGDRNLVRDLAGGKRVVKYGPMFMGAYPGGFAFRSPEDAREYLAMRRLDADKWRVYELAGEFEKDTYRRGARNHIAHSLIVVRELRAEP